MATALFIGRFQPLHKAHVEDIKLILRECSRVIIAIGSAQKSRTEKNPFTLEERKAMVRAALGDNALPGLEVIAIPDIENDALWVDHVKKLCPKFDVVYTGNPYVASLFEMKEIAVERISLIPGFSGTSIREKMKRGDPWEHLVPNHVAQIIESSGFQSQL